jgi:hypothetical protein
MQWQRPIDGANPDVKKTDCDIALDNLQNQ